MLPSAGELRPANAVRSRAPAPSCVSLTQFFEGHRGTAGFVPIDQAIAGGLSADRLGYAFAAGYHAALTALVPSLPDHAVVSFVRDRDRRRPSARDQTTLRPDGERGWRIDGRKRFATLGHEADVLLVVASVGKDAGGKNRLKVVRVDAAARGVTRSRIPDTPFAREIGHAEMHSTR